MLTLLEHRNPALPARSKRAARSMPLMEFVPPPSSHALFALFYWYLVLSSSTLVFMSASLDWEAVIGEEGIAIFKKGKTWASQLGHCNL